MCHQHNIFGVLDDGILVFPMCVSLTRSMYGVVDSECSLGLLSIVVLVDFAESEGLFRHFLFLVDVILNLREIH